MEPNPIRTASHIGLWIIIVGIGVYLVYSATHTNTENNKYGSGTIPITHETHNYGLINLNPCGALFNFTPDKPKAIKNDRNI